MQVSLGQQKPEAGVFSEYHGQRSGILIVDVKKASRIPAFAEPWFLLFNAGVDLRPTIIARDLAASGMEGLSKVWG
jgi:hypothetical protein